jgi:hypothetical protein
LLWSFEYVRWLGGNEMNGFFFPMIVFAVFFISGFGLSTYEKAEFGEASSLSSLVLGFSGGGFVLCLVGYVALLVIKV